MLHAMSNQMGPQQRHSPRCWAASAKSEAIFFPQFLTCHFLPMPHTHPGSTRSAQFLSSLALCKLWPQPTAALGPSCLETAERQHPDEPGEAPGCQAPWVGHDSGAWQESFPRRNSTKAGSQPLCQPMDKAAGSPGAPFLLLLPLLWRAQPASCRVHAAAIPGSVVHLHLNAQLAPILVMS